MPRGLRALALIVFASVAGLLGARAAEVEPDPACTWESAEAVGVIALDRSELRYRGYCVRVRGMLDTRSIGVTRRGDRNERVFIGAYFAEPAMRDDYITARSVEVLGIVGHCRDICADENEALQRQAEAERNGVAPEASEDIPLCMPVGHCHYYDDPYILVQAVRQG